MFRQSLLLCIVMFLSISCNQKPVPNTPTVMPGPEVGETAVTFPEAIDFSPKEFVRVGVPLGGVIHNQVEAGIIHPDEPLTIEFDRALMKNLTQPLTFEPPVEGTFSWNDEGTQLTFTPDSGFATGGSYQISQSFDQMTKYGLPLQEPLVWNIKTLSALHSASSETQENEVISDDEWIITFPIDFEHEVDWENVEEEILIEPAVPVKISWWENGSLQQTNLPDEAGRSVNKDLTSFPEPNQMMVQARVPFDLEQTYRFVLQEWVTGCSCSRVLHEAFVNEFALPPLQAEIVRDDVVPQFRFNYRVDLENLESAAILNPPFETEWTAEWDGDETVLRMDSDKLLPNKILYDFGFSEPVHHPSGVVLAPPKRMLTFPTPFVISDEHPGRENWIKFSPFSDIAITFTHKMDEQSVIDAFQIEPDVPGEFSWEDNTLEFLPERGHLDAFSRYTITVGTSAKNDEGHSVLASPYTWSFETSELPTDADFGVGTKIQVIDANDQRAVQYRSYPTEPISVTFSLHVLTQEDVLQTLRGDWIDRENVPEVITWTSMSESRELDDGHSVIETNVPTDVLPGAYLMTLDTGLHHDELLVFISENRLVVKEAGSQITVWTTKMNGGVAANLDVVVMDENGEIVANGRSSDNGLFQVKLGNGQQAAFVVVQDANDFLITDLISNDWLTYVAASGYSNDYQKPIRTFVYIHTDRSLYRPGDLVSFKGILRDENGDDMKRPPVGTVVTVSLKEPEGDVLQTVLLETNEFGSIDGEFKLAETSISGDYEIKIEVGDGHAISQIFKVDAYQLPPYTVAVSTDANMYKKDEPVFVTVESVDLSGNPIVDASVDVYTFLYDDQRWDEWWHFNSPITGTTDANGRFTFEFDESWGSRFIEAIVSTDTDRSVNGYKHIIFYEEEEFLHLDVGDNYKTLGSSIQGMVTVVDNFGKPVMGREIKFELSHYDPYREVWVKSRFDSGITDEDGQYAFDFTPSELGYFSLYAWSASPQGYRVPDSQSFIVYDKTKPVSSWFNFPGDGELDFVYTEDVYESGEQAELFIQTTVDGPALLTVEMEDVRWQQIVELTSPLKMVEVPILKSDSPNQFVTIMVWEERDSPRWTGYNTLEYQLLASTVSLSVPIPHQTLNVDIVPEKESYQPGEEINVTLRVRDRVGEPVLAELSMSVIDETIFGLSPDFSKPIFDAFYFKRARTLKDYDVMSPDRQLYYSVGDLVGDHSGMSYYGLFDNYLNYDGWRPHSGPHGEFAGTAAWYPTLHTDENGEVTVSFTLPEAQTDWRIQVRAITVDTKVGEASYTLETE